MSQRRPPYRVTPWGTGTVGSEMLTAILDHRQDMRIIGAKVYSDDKDGVDVRRPGRA